MTPDIVFEVSWEACNKVGGIYTVLMSKAALMQKHYKNYWLIGPYIEKSVKYSFIEKRPPKELAQIFETLQKDGIIAHYGTWHIKGEPSIILLETSGYAHKKDEIKKQLWEHYQIDSIYAHWDFEEPMLWATAAGRLLEELSKTNKRIVAHFHEWLAGFGLLYLKSIQSNVATVFTTHATILGRTLSGSGEDLYGNLDNINPDKEAKNRGIIDKHSTEKASAKNADVFTTVSEITGLEAEKLLGRKPDVLVQNGLDIAKFPDVEENSIRHQKNRDDIRNFLKYYFFPHYTFDMEQTLLFFIVGRYEYTNKGIDIFIEALAELNKKMKAIKSSKTVITFFWIPRDVIATKHAMYENRSNFDEIEDYVKHHQHKIQDRLVRNIIKVREGTWKESALTKKILNKTFVEDIQKLTNRFLKNGPAPLTTHDIPFEDQDAILNAFKQHGLLNKKNDKVKVIFYPVYLTGADGLINMAYYDCLNGCHLGVFPSYYEPWGYTPLESAALGVPAITTDLAGFGRFLQAHGQGTQGIFVLERYKKSREQIINQFSKILFDYTELHQHERVNQKMAAKELAALADWKELVTNYFKAHELALERTS